MLCECEASVTLRHTNLGSFFLVLEDVRSVGLGATWNFIKGKGLPWLGHLFKEHRGPVKKAYIHWDRQVQTHVLFYSALFYTIHSITSQTITAFIWMNDKGIVVPMHAMEACGGS